MLAEVKANLVVVNAKLLVEIKVLATFLAKFGFWQRSRSSRRWPLSSQRWPRHPWWLRLRFIWWWRGFKLSTQRHCAAQASYRELPWCLQRALRSHQEQKWSWQTIFTEFGLCRWQRLCAHLFVASMRFARRQW